jgi:hypothetical protein
MTTHPDHYHDDGPRGEQRGLCPHSGASRAHDRAPCPRGCAGALWHYANDGHPGCADPLPAL